MLIFQSWIGLLAPVLILLGIIIYYGWKWGYWQRLYRVYRIRAQQAKIETAVQQREAMWQARQRADDAQQSDIASQQELDARLRAVDRAYQHLDHDGKETK